MPDKVVPAPAGTPEGSKAAEVVPPVAGTPGASPAPAAPAAPTPAPAEPVKSVVVPMKYDLKAPEGSRLSKASLERIATEARQRGLSQEQAQEEVGRQHAVVEDYAKTQQEAVEATINTWAKTLGEKYGDGFKEKSEMVKRGFAKFASKELLDLMDSTGMGNHPAVFELGVKLGELIKEDKLVLPGASGATALKSTKDVLYDGNAAQGAAK